MLTTLSPSITHHIRAPRFQDMSHSTPETTNTYGGNSYLTNHTYLGTQNRRHTIYLDNNIQIMTNEDFTVKGHPGQVIGFIAHIHMSTPEMSLLPPTLLLATQKHHYMQETKFIKAI